MITPYYGEFLVSPIPLEMSLNYCSHGCSFCFANLGNRTRKANMRQIMGLLSSYRQRRTLEALLLCEGYPVLLSNRVDPFANSNSAQALTVIEVCTELGIPLAIQTRGGRGWREAAAMMPSSCWYVSVNTLDEDRRSKLEPGAPSIAARLAMIEDLVAAGHQVSVGFNPAVPEWQPDPRALLDAVKGVGAEGVWIEALHFNRDQLAAMSPRERESIGEPIVARANKRAHDDDTRDWLRRCREEASAAGLSVMSAGNPAPSDYWRPYLETYDRTFPTMLDFTNACHEAEAEYVTFADFAAWMLLDLPDGNGLPIDGYIGSVARNVMREELTVPWHEGPYKVPPRMGFAELLALYWTQPRIRLAPVASGAFSYVAEGGTQSAPQTQLVDASGMPLMRFHPEGTADWWHIEDPADGE